MSIQLRAALTLVLMFVLGGIFLVAETQKDGRDVMVFCDVGQGDGFFINHGSVQVVVDGGLGLKMTECLAQYMPMWDREIELMVLTHPQRDHMEGQIEVFKRFDVKRVIWSGALGEGGLFEEWQQLGLAEKSEIIEVARGDRLEAGGMEFEVLWPTKSFTDLWKVAPGSDLNETSLVLRMNSGELCAYLTGDITVERLVDVADKKCEILKVSHHGSKTGTNAELLGRISPKLAVIQVGRSNNYGHPNGDVMSVLQTSGVEIMRNDTEGDIKLYIDGDGVYLDK